MNHMAPITIDQLPVNIAQYRVSDDGDFIVLDLNAMALRTEKVSKEASLGHKVIEVFPGIKEMGLLDVFKRVYRSGQTEILELAYYDDDRISGWRKNTVSRLGDKTIMAVYEDVGVLKELERQVDRSISESRALKDESEAKALDLQKAQKLAKIGSWKYKIVEDKLIWSDETYRIFQIDKRTHPIKRLDDFFKNVDPIYIEVVTREYDRHLNQNMPYEITHELRLDDGTSKWIKERCETIYDEHLVPIESNGILQDITQQKSLEDELLKEKKLLEDAQDLAHLGSWEWDIKDDSLFWSDEVYKIFGETVGAFELTADRFFSYVVEEDIPLVREAVEYSLQSREEYKVIHRVLRSDGSVRHVRETGRPYYNDQDEPVWMIGSVLDITDMHNTRLELERKQEELQKTFDVNPNIIIITDGKDIIQANDKFLLFTGFDTLKDFQKEYRCICDLFENSFGHIRSQMDGKDWVSYVIEHDQQVHTALIRRDGYEHVFSIHADNYVSDGDYRNIVVLEDITKIEQAAYRDFLTSLYNRKKITSLLMDLYQFFGRYKRVFAVIMVDIDDFKTINDSFGHHTGDHVLQEMAKVFDAIVREADAVGRWGGEEFLIACPETSMVGACKLAEDIRKAIEKHDFGHIGKKTVSLGVNCVEQGMSVEELIQGADEALYDAKKRGKNCVACYSKGDDIIDSDSNGEHL